MTAFIAPVFLPKVAGYLRCYPHDPTDMAENRIVMRNCARSAGMPEPFIYLDNDCPSRAAKPRLEELIEAVDAGLFLVVMIPGPWVFSLDEQVARSTAQRLSRGCCGIWETASPRIDRQVHRGHLGARAADFGHRPY
ncbi:hypothetical protein ACHBTE_15330 [Streptomyces sp. M41]|uniref:hypothetical protein n=1 Tax=Streptomyces sp. M41 TaxID=3059412 RepID=UPI00374DBBDB